MILGNDRSLSRHSLSTIVNLLNARRYSAWNPAFKSIVGISVDGKHELDFAEWTRAEAYLIARGGSIQLWKTESGSCCREIGLGYTPAVREISLFVTHDLRQDRETDVQLVAELWSVFADLCRQLEPVYGYSTDEYRLERALAGAPIGEMMDDLRIAVSRRAPPPLLFWLNYFCSDYFDQLPRLVLPDSNLVESRACRGVNVLLGTHPWKGQVARLQPSGKYELLPDP